MKLYRHLRVPETMTYTGYYQFGGEEVLLHYLHWNRNGWTKLQMSTNKFGGDPRRFTYSIRIMTDHLYNNFYHKISGDSMRMWIPNVNSFRHAIWQRLQNAVTIESNNDVQRYVYLNIPLDSIRIFGFMGDTGF